MTEHEIINIGDLVAFPLVNGKYSSPGIIIKKEFKIDGMSGGSTVTVVDMEHPFFSPGVVVPISLLRKITITPSGNIADSMG